ncbi:ShlB/FhaC/HecB family hemolysin secretion/activation protein [Phenylobacterium sp.]|uniref:two-partner secretion domain-containing protein n=1 Tax=Phenylobacterium sp. TaxID=1871053 RepID=UPI002F419DB8
MRRAQLLVSAAALALMAAAPAAAQVTTNITPDTNAFATGTTVSRSGAVTTISGGTLAGGNLFHSFTTFNLAATDAAVWTAANPASVTNVINRVTGGTFSTIAGLIDTSQLPHASFYFINPAGVLFTGNAFLNVPGAAYISTADDGLKFADGFKFSATAPNGSNFSMSAPQSFGFLGAQQPILIETNSPFLPNNTVDLSLFASDVGMLDAAFTPRTLTISTTGALRGAISLADPFGTAPLAGSTVLINSLVSATATGAGTPSVRVATGAFSLSGGALSSSTFFSGDAGDLLLAAQTADIENGGLFSSNTDVAQANAGTVSLNVGALHVGTGGTVSSSTFSTGAAGSVIVNANTVLVDGQGAISSASHDRGAAGAVTINAASVRVDGLDSLISSDAADPTSARAGSVQISAGAVSVTNQGVISSSTTSAGDAGTVQIVANTVSVDGGAIDSVSLGGTGRAGLVSVQAGQITLTNDGDLGSFTDGAGAAGSVQVKAGTLTLSNQGNVTSSTLGSGAAGDVTIDAATLNATTGAFIASNSIGTGRAGLVTISGTNLSLDNSVVSSETDNSGAGGDITINASSVSVTNNSQIVTDTFGSGAAGRVTITADKLSVDFASVFSDAAPGSTGAGGSVSLNLGQLQLTDQSVVSSDTFGAGAAGSVAVTAKGVSLTGDSSIESAAREGSGGAAGQVAIHASALTMDNSLISSSTFAAGDAGGVLVSSNTISLANASSIESGAGPGSSGRGGQVQIQADSLSVASTSGIVTSTVSSGDAGALTISATDIVVDEAQLASRAQDGATGAAGSLTIQGQTLSVVNGGQVETASENPKTAGGIAIAMRGAVTVSGEGSIISSANTSATPGAAGSIAISAGPITIGDGGSITTNSVAGAAGDISLSLPRNSYVLLEGATAPGVITTSSGPGTGGRITIADPVAIISNGGRILALGQERGANVQLTSDFFIRSVDRTNELAVDGLLVLDSQVSDVSTGAVIPDISFLDASGVLRGQCPAARNSGLTSQLRMRPFGPYAGAQGGRTLSLTSAGPAGCLFAPEGVSRGLWARARAAVAADAASAHAQPAFAQVGANPPLATPSFASTVTLADVQVSADPGAGRARPLAGWKAGPDAATGLTLQAPGAGGFDAAWVRQQFVANRLVGQAAPLDRLLALAQLINLTFVRNGYVNSGVLFAGPIPQDGGTLQIKLVYGHGGATGMRVRFAPGGGKGLSEAYVRQRMAAAQAAPFNALDVEQQFRRLAQDPAVRTVSADLVPGAAPGEANLEVVVDPAPRYDLYATVANSRSPSIGGERYALGGSVRNLAVPGDLATGEVGVTGGRADESLGYDAPLFSPSTVVTLRASHDDAAVVDELLRPLGIRSTDWSVEGGLGWKALDRPLTPDTEGGGFRPAQSLTFGLHVSHREQETWLLGQPFSFSPGSQDGKSQYTALRLTADYVQRGATQVLAVSAVGVQGLGGSHSDGAGALDPSGDFRDVLVQASYARRLDAAGLELRLRGAAQWADGPLYTGERFTLGGEDTVRGYRENLILADTGAFASAELAQPFSLDDGRRGYGRMDWGAFTASAFVDGGVAKNRQGPNPDPPSLSSVGVSLAWTPSEALFAKLTYAKALRAAPLAGDRDMQDRGFEFRVTVRPLAFLP